MKASELIEDLQTITKEQGDLEVVYSILSYDGWEEGRVDYVDFDPYFSIPDESSKGEKVIVLRNDRAEELV